MDAQQISKEQWIDQAVMELGRRLPHLSLSDVFKIVKGDQFPEPGEINALEAAEIYALELPPTELGAPGNS